VNTEKYRHGNITTCYVVIKIVLVCYCTKDSRNNGKFSPLSNS